MSEPRPATLYINGIPSPGLCEITGIGDDRLLEQYRRDFVAFTPGVTTATITGEFILGIRESRLLLTGRPRRQRKYTKRWNKERQRLRRQLVHAAGCHFRFETVCASRQCERDDFSTSPRVSVPRSLRSKLGLCVGGCK